MFLAGIKLQYKYSDETWEKFACSKKKKKSVSYLLQLSFVFFPVTLPHVPLLSFVIRKGDQAIKTLQTLSWICTIISQVVS